jgi:hypothetical protein
MFPSITFETGKKTQTPSCWAFGTLQESSCSLDKGEIGQFRPSLSPIPNGHRDRCLMHIQPNILGVIHEGAPCCR